MGYSCTVAAANVLDAIEDYLREKYPDTPGKPSSNGWMINGRKFFFERGKENDDGAITGTVYSSDPASNRCHRAGSVRIEPEGTVTRFAHVPKSVIASVTADVLILGRRRSIRFQVPQPVM